MESRSKTAPKKARLSDLVQFQDLATDLGLDSRLPHVTSDTVEKALAGFAVPFLPGRDMDWLAAATRRALAITIPNTRDGPERTSNVDIRAALERLAGSATQTWQELFQCDPAVDWHLFSYTYSKLGSSVDDGDDVQTLLGLPPQYERFNAAVSELLWLSDFLRRAAADTEISHGPWVQSEQKKLRVERGQYLAVIFEAAYGLLVSANNYPNDQRHKAPTAFMDFYARLVTLAFDPRATTNLAEIVKMACREHRLYPVYYGAGIIPGL